jgi:hypothetical protein
MSDGITAQNIVEYLENRDDFDLELFAHRELIARGWPAHHGGTYVDSVTGKFRQYDVRAIKPFANSTYVSLSVECKSLTQEHPLLVSRVPRSLLDSYHHLTACLDDPDVPNAVSFSVKKSGERLPLYRTDDMVGKAITQVHWDKKAGGGRLTTSDSETHEKWSQALASTADNLEGAGTFSGDGAAYTFHMPVLLVSDHTLWVVDYADDGTRAEPRQEDEATLFVGREYKCGLEQCLHLTHLHIYTRTGFKAMLGNLASPTGLLWDRMFGFLFRPEKS